MYVQPVVAEQTCDADVSEDVEVSTVLSSLHTYDSLAVQMLSSGVGLPPLLISCRLKDLPVPEEVYFTSITGLAPVFNTRVQDTRRNSATASWNQPDHRAGSQPGVKLATSVVSFDLSGGPACSSSKTSHSICLPETRSSAMKETDGLSRPPGHPAAVPALAARNYLRHTSSNYLREDDFTGMSISSKVAHNQPSRVSTQRSRRLHAPYSTNVEARRPKTRDPRLLDMISRKLASTTIANSSARSEVDLANRQESNETPAHDHPGSEATLAEPQSDVPTNGDHTSIPTPNPKLRVRDLVEINRSFDLSYPPELEASGSGECRQQDNVDVSGGLTPPHSDAATGPDNSIRAPVASQNPELQQDVNRSSDWHYPPEPRDNGSGPRQRHDEANASSGDNNNHTTGDVDKLTPGTF